MIPTVASDNVSAPYSRQYARRIFKIQENRERARREKEKDVLSARASSEFYIPETKDVSRCHSSQKHFGVARPVSAGKILRPNQIKPEIVAGNESIKIELQREELAHQKLHHSIKMVLKEENSKRHQPKPWVPSRASKGYATDLKSKHKHVNQEAVEYGIINKAWRRAPWPSMPNSATATVRLLDTSGNMDAQDLDVRFADQLLASSPQSEIGSAWKSAKSTKDKLVTKEVKAAPHIVITGVLIDRSAPEEHYRHGILLVSKDSSTMDIARAIEKQFNFKGISDLSLTTQGNGYGSKDATTRSLSLGTLDAFPMINETTTFVAFTGGEPIDLSLPINADPDNWIDSEAENDIENNRISKTPTAGRVVPLSKVVEFPKRSVFDFAKTAEREEELKKRMEFEKSQIPVHHNRSYELSRAYINSTGTFSSPGSALVVDGITPAIVERAASPEIQQPMTARSTKSVRYSPNGLPKNSSNKSVRAWSAAGDDASSIGGLTTRTTATNLSVRSSKSRGQRMWEAKHGLLKPEGDEASDWNSEYPDDFASEISTSPTNSGRGRAGSAGDSNGAFQPSRKDQGLQQPFYINTRDNSGTLYLNTLVDNTTTKDADSLVQLSNQEEIRLNPQFSKPQGDKLTTALDNIAFVQQNNAIPSSASRNILNVAAVNTDTVSLVQTRERELDRDSVSASSLSDYHDPETNSVVSRLSHTSLPTATELPQKSAVVDTSMQSFSSLVQESADAEEEPQSHTAAAVDDKLENGIKLDNNSSAEQITSAEPTPDKLQPPVVPPLNLHDAHSHSQSRDHKGINGHGNSSSSNSGSTRKHNSSNGQSKPAKSSSDLTRERIQNRLDAMRAKTNNSKAH